MRISNISRLTLAAAVCVTAACGGDSAKATGPDVVDNAAFSGSVTGDYTRTLSGSAAAGRETTADYGDVYAIALTDGNPSDTASGAIVFSHVGSNVSQKTYDVADVAATSGNDAPNPFGDKFFALYVPSSTSGIDEFFYTSGGSVTISAISSTRVKGSFDVTMKNAIAAPGTALKTIHVKGSFDAPVGSVPNGTALSRANARVDARVQASRAAR